MRVRDCNVGDEYLQVKPDESLLSVKKKYCHFLVVVKDKKPIGIVTNNDIARNIKSEEDYEKLKFEDIMTKDVVSVKLDDDLEDVGKLMFKKELMSLPVIDDDGNFVGLVTYSDYIGKVAKRIKDNMKSE